jgi:conjugative transfer signal peptidase TraF
VKAARSRKIFILIILFFLVLGLLVYGFRFLGYHITYQATPSVPKGFYVIKPVQKISRGDLVVFLPLASVQDFMQQHHWIPDSGWLMKVVSAVPGDEICRRHDRFWVNGVEVAQVFHFYAPGKKLPQYYFCGRVPKDQYFLLGPQHPHSFDSRYFGFVSRSQIIGNAVRLNLS